MDFKLGFLALIVALSAYIASVRFAIIGRLGSTPAPRQPKRLKFYLVSLIFADGPLVVAGLFLTADMFVKELFGHTPPDWLYLWTQRLFVGAVVVLAFHHFISWINSIYKAFCG